MGIVLGLDGLGLAFIPQRKPRIMAEYFAIAPVTLTLTVVVGKKTAGGKLAATDVMVTSIDGKPSGNDGAYYAFAGQWGDVVLNFKAGGRPAKPAKEAKPAPKALTTAQVTAIPANGTKPAKGKGKVAGAPAAPAAPDMAAMFAAFQQFMAGQK